MDVARIRHVAGNVLRLAIPLTLRVIELNDEGGTPVATDSDFVPNSSYPVEVLLTRGSKGLKEYRYQAHMSDGNVAVMEDRGEIETGTYSVTVLCRNDAGDPMRFKQKQVVQIVDLTAEAGIEAGIEFEAQTHYLSGAVYMAVSGVGIANIITHESQESGGENTVTIVLTDGREYTFAVRNGVDGNAVLRHEAIEPSEFEERREAGTLSENTIYLVYEDEAAGA